MDMLQEAKRVVQTPKGETATMEFNSLKILSNELGVLLPAYEGEFMSTLTDIYDGSPYEERRRSSKTGPMVIPKPQFNLLAATTPAHLTDFLPAGAFDQGFLSRCFLVYSGEIILRPLFDEDNADTALDAKLLKDFRTIGRLYGPMLFDPEAAEAINSWHMAGRPPAPGHPKLHNYNTRRTTHLLRLCMVASASETDSLTISIEHYRTALEWMLEIEAIMPDIFKSMATGGDAKAMDECWYACFQMYSVKKEPVPEAKVFRFLQERVPAHNVERIVQIMTRSGMLRAVDVNKLGVCYVPLERKQF